MCIFQGSNSSCGDAIGDKLFYLESRTCYAILSTALSPNHSDMSKPCWYNFQLYPQMCLAVKKLPLLGYSESAERSYARPFRPGLESSETFITSINVIAVGLSDPFTVSYC